MSDDASTLPMSPAPLRGLLGPRALLASPQIFATPTMRARHEAAARANLRALLAQHRYAWWGLWL